MVKARAIAIIFALGIICGEGIMHLFPVHENRVIGYETIAISVIGVTTTYAVTFYRKGIWRGRKTNITK